MPKLKTSIEEIGLENHLEATRHDHNDMGYSFFVHLFSKKVNAPKAVVARIYGVSSPTIKKWKNIHDKESKS